MVRALEVEFVVDVYVARREPDMVGVKLADVEETGTGDTVIV